MNLATAITVVFTTIFLAIILSYYLLLLWPGKKNKPEQFSSITIIIPAHNEAKYIASAIEAAIASSWKGKKEIIVIDDGSTDNTASIVKRYPVKLLHTDHIGKAAAMNKALKLTKTQLVAIVDGDSCIDENSLIACSRKLSKNVGAVTAVVKVKNRGSLLGFWMHMEQLYNSLIRGLYAKANVNIVATGPLSVFRRDGLEKVGGFSTQGYSEDIDIAVRLIKAGYRIEQAEDAFTETNMPTAPKSFLRQRKRFARGMVNIFQKYLNADHLVFRIYTIPLFFFTYLQAVIMGSIILYNIISGYITYFASKGVYLSWYVVKFLVGWLTIVGVINWTAQVLSGQIPLTIVEIVGIASSLLSYPLLLWAAVKYDKLSLWHILIICFMFPFWLMIMVIYILNIGAWFQREQYNRWQK